ncbi:TIGR02536 family ethanolamine utilization protein [Clostridium subterminale]|uniref:TIGR02536 family ethanolamine utilization protein n=1 Tax=Clostridium subterminale TaxID=1550 RepID=A0ABN1KUP1_CLOSU
MNYDKLVDLIVKEVYKKLEETNRKNIRHKTAVVIGDVELDPITKANLNEEYRMIYYGEEALEADIAVVSRLSIKSMANIATLTGINEEENFIINMLLAGKRVYVLENGLEYRKYKNTAPRALYNKYLSFEKELKVYGIDIVEAIEKVEDKTTRKEEYKKVEEVSILETSNSISEEMSFEIRNKKLISEMDLRKPFMNGMKSVVIDKKSIITPLANDFIRIHNLKVKRV